MNQIKTYWNRLGFRFTILFVLLALLPMAIVGIQAYYKGRTAMEQNVINRLSTITLLKESEFNRWNTNNQELLRLMAQRPLVREYAEALVQLDARVDPEYETLRRNLVQGHFQPTLDEESGYIDFALIRARDGLILVSTDEPLEGKYRESEDFFIQGKLDTFVQYPVYHLTEEKAIMHVSTPVKDHTGRVVAVLTGHVELNEMSNILSLRSEFSASEETYLVNHSNLLITETRLEAGAALRKSIFSQGVSDCLVGNDGVGFYEDYRGVPVVGYYRWMEAEKLCILTEEDQTEAFMAIEQLYTTILFTVMIAVVGSVVVGFLTTRSITRPLQALEQSAVRIGQGELDHHVNVHGGEEIENLAKAFNQMATNLNEADQENQSLVEELRDWSEQLEIRVEERTHELKEEKALSESLISSLPGIFYLFDTQGNFKRWNNNFERVSEYSPAEIADAHPIDFFVGDEKELVQQRIQKAFIKGSANVEAQFTSKNGKGIPYYLTGVSIELEGQPHLIGTGVDITERIQAEQALTQKAAELERSNDELEQFAYIASHDLQEPLRKIQSFGGRLGEKYQDVLDQRGQDYLARMQDAAERGQRMINDLLELSRVTTQGQPFQKTDLNQVIQNVLSDLEMQIKESVGYVEVADLPVIDADPTQMHQLFQNLISNGLKFHQADTHPIVKVSCSDEEIHQVQIVVSDNGIGFDNEHSERIFQPFQRLHGRSEFKGSGIGLSVCRKIVQRHYGSITASSAPGEGARFLITLSKQHSLTDNNEGYDEHD
jgi:PAS domain S-box-containing protein